MKNKIIYFFLISLLSFNLFSNENTLRPGSGVYEFHFFNVTNPAGFVAAIETFDSSSCASKWRKESGANVGLYSRMGGGHSHIILVAYLFGLLVIRSSNLAPIAMIKSASCITMFAS